MLFSLMLDTAHVLTGQDHTAVVPLMPKDKDGSGSTRYSTEERFCSLNAKSQQFLTITASAAFILISPIFLLFLFPFILSPLPFSVPTPLFYILTTILILLMSCVVCFFTITSVHGIAPFTTLFGMRICDLLSDFLCVLHQNVPNIKPCCHFSHLSYSLNVAMSIHLLRCFSRFPIHVTTVVSIPHKYHFM